mgnify:CR=1 FL=1
MPSVIVIVAINIFFIEFHNFSLVESFVVFLVELFLHVNQWFAIDVGFDEEAEVFINFLI